MSVIELAGQAHDFSLPWAPADAALAQPECDALPMPGQPLQAHLRELYPQHQAARLRLAYARPEHELRSLYNPQHFTRALGSLVEQLLASQAPGCPEAAALVQALLADRRTLECCVNVLLKV
ncbi:hypothetical protein [Pseudomonas hunanensis]|jgi:type III secretion protein X|uniref:type III secretion apparatus assembly protein SctX n=1 Tax=Pseudomonas hunanensis TaxID=1247546 RepID=UPI002404DB42|nr:hypothetical protein [Pseudomonas hunanensis]MDF9757601.1 type III secretion protein X [Pseudomonas hunanensis]